MPTFVVIFLGRKEGDTISRRYTVHVHDAVDEQDAIKQVEATHKRVTYPVVVQQPTPPTAPNLPKK